MNPFLSHLHSELRRARLTRRGASLTPNDVPQGKHKRYERMEHILLPEVSFPVMPLFDAIHSRTSYFGGSAEAQLTLQELSSLLATLKKRTDNHRNYPSGGALYPVETYLITTMHKNLAAFHYNPTEHSLEKLWLLPPNFDLKKLAKKPDDLYFSTMVIFTGVWSRSSAKYGDLAYQHTLLEAGHMSQNILLAATALGIPSRPYAGFDDEALLEHLDLLPEEEQPLHTIVLSK